MPNMKYSKDGAKLTELFEQCRLHAYQDSKGVWTIGWGHTGPEVCEGLVWTQEKADATLLQDVQSAENCVNRYVTAQLTQHEFDALVDFVFNVGSGNFSGSTLLKLLNAGDYHGASEQFERWDKCAGKVLAGLLRRRIAEEAEFNATS